MILLLAVGQTSWAKNHLRLKLIEWAAAQGIELSIERLDGRLPLEWRLKNVRLSKEGSAPLTCEELDLRLKFLPLFLGRIDCPHLSAKQCEFLSIPFEARAAFRGLEVKHLTIEGNGFALAGSALFAPSSINCSLTCSDLKQLQALIPFPVEGQCTGTLAFDSSQLSAELNGESLKIAEFPLQSTVVQLHAEPCNDGWQGALELLGGHEQIPLSLSLVFSSPQSAPIFTIEEAILKGPDTLVQGKFSISADLEKWVGNLSGSCANLKQWRPLLPDLDLSGSVQLDLQIAEESFTCAIEGQQFAIFETQWDAFDLKTEFERGSGHLVLNSQGGRYREISLANLQASAYLKDKIADFSIQTAGQWKDALEMRLDGKISPTSLTIDQFTGFALKKAFKLKEPLTAEWSPSHFKLFPLNLEVGLGAITGRVDLAQEATLIKLEATECPLDFLSLFSPDLGIKGLASASIDLIGWQGSLRGKSHLLIDWMELLPYGRETPLHGKGSLQMHFDQKRMQVHALLRAEENQLVDFSGTIPLEFSALPFAIAIDSSRPYSTDLTGEIDLGELLQFVNIGPQRLEGLLSARLHHTHQGLTGELELQNGVYENYATGALLKDVFAKAHANEQSIEIYTLTANDENRAGSLKATGKMELFPNFTYFFEGNLENFQAISDHIVNGRVDGHLIISGDKKSATAKGELELVEAHLTIPDRLPTELPELEITFINTPPHLLKREALKARVPFYLDLDLNAPKQIFVEGRGLNCELKGNLHLSGTYTAMAARGVLSLLKGEYLFCGKVFNLNQANLIFKDKPTPSGSIELAGTCDLSDVTATVSVRGPLSAPSLTLQSIPQLSTSALIARLLFNKDISEVSPLQALQLAQTLLSISGSSGPSDLFEKVRKTLHIDRFTLLTSENDPGKISLQIGKYLMRGVLLTLVQGATSRNVAVEVELARGFTLQAEMNEKQQSKFSLKWNHHY